MRKLVPERIDVLVRLATPIVLARSGIIVMSTIDMIMVGRFSAEDLAFFSIANSIIMPIVVIGLGLLAGTIVLSAHQHGAGDLRGCGMVWRSSLLYALVIGLFGLLLSIMGEPVLLMLGQTQSVSENGGRIMVITGLNLPAFMLVLTTAYFLEGIKRPMPWMIVMIATNIINIFLNWVLIFGNLNAPAMGAEGAAWATTIVRYISALMLITYVVLMPDHGMFGIRQNIMKSFWPSRRQRRLGYASSISLAAETLSFASLSILAGWVSVLALAAYGVTFNLITMVFMVTLGLGSATSVLVGNAHGAGDHRELTLMGWTGLGVNTAFMFVFGVLFFLGAETLASLFSSDMGMIEVAIPMIVIAAFFLISDGGQGIMVSALRGRQDVWVPSAIQVLSYFGVMLPLAYMLAIVNGRGAVGLMEAALIGSLVSVSLLMLRFLRLNSMKTANGLIGK